MPERNSRYFETAELMDEALLALLQEKDLEFVTVKEVCARAGVSRSTFYLHYETVNDLLQESMELVIGRFLERFDEEPAQLIARIGNPEVAQVDLMQRCCAPAGRI